MGNTCLISVIKLKVMTKKQGRYYGQKHIKQEVWGDDGSDVLLRFDDGTTEVLRKKMYDVAVSDELLAGNLSELRERRMKLVVEDLLQVLLDWDIKPFDPMNELEYVMTMVKNNFQYNLDKAFEVIWGIKKEDIKFSDINNALKGNGDGGKR